jgi:hypothetical protein
MGGFKNQMTTIPEGFIQGRRFEGVINGRGQKAGIEQNWGYHAKDNDGKDCILMYCNPGVFVIADSLDGLRMVHEKQVSWYLMKTGYVGCHAVRDGIKTCLTMHQVIMNHDGHGKGGPSIDHINRNKLDNRRMNLRITTQSVQNENRDKVARHRTAKELPEEIQEELPKFVVYYKENVNMEATREFFSVEGHPLQKLKEEKVINSQTNQLISRRWASTKSNKISIVDKLQQAKSYVAELNQLILNPEYQMKSIIKSTEEHTPIVNEIIIPNKKVEEKVPKQWKTKQIYEFIQENKEHHYKTHCEQNNTLQPDWNESWITFVLSVKGKSYQDSEQIIRSFVEKLRRIRHHALCVKDTVEREDREQWPAITVVKAFLEGKLDKFKAYTETRVGEKPEDPIWIKRWATFMTSLEQNRDDANALEVRCSKFMAAQRIKKYRASKTGSE